MFPATLPSPLQRARESVASALISADLEDEAQEIAYDAMEVTDNPAAKIRLVEEALAVYPLSTEAWSVLGCHYLDSRKPYLALICFETAVTAARRIDPSCGIDRTEPLEWGYIENRPYLRAMRGLAKTYLATGDLHRAIETAELLSRWKNTALDSSLCGWYLRAGRLGDAERFIQALKKETRYQDCGIDYSRVLLKYHNVQCGRAEASELFQALKQALKSNPYAPDLLLAPESPLETPSSYGGGDEREAILYAFDNHTVWRSFPGALDWLAESKSRHGDKPDEPTLIQLLRGKQPVFLCLSDGRAFPATQNRDCMRGRALPDFRVPPQVTARHTNGGDICVQNHDTSSDDWVSFRYTDLAGVPFWNVLLTATLEDEETKEEEVSPPGTPKCWFCSAPETPDKKHKRCSVCSMAMYCSRECQTKDWKRKHKKECKRIKESKIWGELDTQTLSVITSYLNLKEKAVVSTLNKAWLEASTCDKSVSIDPDVVGANLNAVLGFVGRRFRNLLDVDINIEQRHFLLENNFHNEVEPLLLQGSSLSSFFDDCPPLNSVCLRFPECVENHTSRILVQERGLESFPRHTSLQSLVLCCTYFDNLQSLVHVLTPLTNLRHLSMDATAFGDAAYQGGEETDIQSTPWRSGSDLLVVVGGMTNLRSLLIDQHGLTDLDMHQLIPIFPGLRVLSLGGQFGDSPPALVSLTDSSLELIGAHCSNLQRLDVSYNRRLTSDGIRELVKTCPLRELCAYQTGLSAADMVDLVELCPTLRLVRFGNVAPMISKEDEKRLRKATIASGGRVVFSLTNCYEPTFDRKLMDRHEEAVEALRKLEATESNGWNEWEDWPLE